MLLQELFKPGSSRILTWRHVYDRSNKSEYYIPMGDVGSKKRYEVIFSDVYKTVNEHIHKFGLEELPPDIDHVWEIIFGYVDEMGYYTEDPLGTGNEFPVFATIVDIVRNFIERRKAKAFFFSGAGASRMRLYSRFARELAKMIDGKVAITPSKTGFLIYQDETDYDL